MSDSKQVLRLQIERPSYGPQMIAKRDDGKTILVEGAMPGDLVEVEILKEHPRYSEARTLRVLRPSSQRVAQICEYIDICGGCPWAGLDYADQLSYKRQSLLDALSHIGKITAAEQVSTIRPQERTWAYRNKVVFDLSPTCGKLKLGLHARRSSRVIPVEHCPLLAPPLQDLPQRLNGALNYLFHGHGDDLLRVQARAALHLPSFELALWTSTAPLDRALLAKVIQDALPRPGLTSLVRVLVNPRRQVRGVERLAGSGYWQERLAGYGFKVSAPSFFQVNTAAAEGLVEAVMHQVDGLGLAPDSQVADLFCGVGSFTLPLAKRFAHVVAIEKTASSLQDLRRNLKDNQLGDKVQVYGDEVGHRLKLEGRYQLILVDPPRSGLDPAARALLLDARPCYLIYISCNPSSLARDLTHFLQDGYRLRQLRPFDLFPQSYHLESLCLLKDSR